MVTADLDRHFPIKPFQKIEQLVRREAAEMPVHQMRYVGLCNAQNVGDFALFQLLVFEDIEDMESDLRARQKLIGIFETQIRENVSGPTRFRNPLRTQLAFVFSYSSVCAGDPGLQAGEG